MNQKHRIARYIAYIVGALLVGIGILHDIVNIPWLMRAMARGDVPAKIGEQMVANAAFAGLALAFLGVLLFLIASDLGKGRHAASRIGIAIGLFMVLTGIAAYMWIPREGVLIFSAMGALVCGPPLIWRKEFRVE